jgi:hypothetical protein
MTHPSNTIPDAVWRSISARSTKAPSGSAERARRVRLAGLQYRAAKKGLN